MPGSEAVKGTRRKPEEVNLEEVSHSGPRLLLGAYFGAEEAGAPCVRPFANRAVDRDGSPHASSRA